MELVLLRRTLAITTGLLQPRQACVSTLIRPDLALSGRRGTWPPSERITASDPRRRSIPVRGRSEADPRVASGFNYLPLILLPTSPFPLSAHQFSPRPFLFFCQQFFCNVPFRLALGPSILVSPHFSVGASFFCGAIIRTRMNDTSASPGQAWLAFTLLTVVTWGVYGILLHKGQVAMVTRPTDDTKRFCSWALPTF